MQGFVDRVGKGGFDEGKPDRGESSERGRGVQTCGDREGDGGSTAAKLERTGPSWTESTDTDHREWPKLAIPITSANLAPAVSIRLPPPAAHFTDTAVDSTAATAASLDSERDQALLLLRQRGSLGQAERVEDFGSLKPEQAWPELYAGEEMDWAKR